MAALTEDDRRLLNSGDPEINRIRYINFMIIRFARGFWQPEQEAYRYLHDFGGLDFLDSHYEYLHTQSVHDTAMDLLQVCRKNGGWL